MKAHKNYILENLNIAIKKKGLTLENIASNLEISASELSKILNGKRADYGKYVYPLTKILEVNFLDLTKPSHLHFVNQEESYERDIKNAATENQSTEETLRLFIDKCNEVAAVREKWIETLLADVEYWKGKYYRLKARYPLDKK
jgi:transcriptional regulator with XRE-family HTH domain